LGILSSDSISEVTLTASNQGGVKAESLVLWDTYLDKKTDLKTTGSYTFVNVPNTPDRFVLMIDNVIGAASAAAVAPVRASVSDHTLRVSAGSDIAEVAVFSPQGVLLSKDTNIGQTAYTKTVDLQKGVYLVSVKLKTGETSVVKVLM